MLELILRVQLFVVLTANWLRAADMSFTLGPEMGWIQAVRGWVPCVRRVGEPFLAQRASYVPGFYALTSLG